MYAFTREHIRSDLLVSAHACMYLLVNEHGKTPALHLHIQEKKIFQTMKRSKRGHTTATICSFYLSAKIFIQHNAKHEHHTTPHHTKANVLCKLSHRHREIEKQRNLERKQIKERDQIAIARHGVFSPCFTCTHILNLTDRSAFEISVDVIFFS